MKKPTIESLQKQIADLTAKHQSEYNCRIQAVNDYRKSQDTIEQKDRERRELERQHEVELKRERSARESAEAVYDNHRNAVLAYFMAEANPVTAADKARMMELQAAVCGAVISRHISSQEVSPRY